MITFNFRYLSIIKFSFICLSITMTQYTIAQNAQNFPNWKTDTSNHLVPISEFKSLLPRDAIVPIDSPKFVSIHEADTMYFEREPFIVVRDDGPARAYPLSVLMWHEIVNDQLADKKIVITYCPLCNAALVFGRERPWKGKHLIMDFGTSGMLRKSDLVMWDRQTESWWQQIEGKALVGTLAGASLERIPSQVLSFQEFKSAYPDGIILSNQTGLNYKYGSNPYISYDDTGNLKPRLFDENVDPRLPAMERVIAIDIEGNRRAYPWSTIQKMGIIQETYANRDIVVFYQQGAISVLDQSIIQNSHKIGSATVFSPKIEGKLLHFVKVTDGFQDAETKSLWNISGQCVSGPYKDAQLESYFYTSHFAFAYLEFFPDTGIYKN